MKIVNNTLSNTLATVIRWILYGSHDSVDPLTFFQPMIENLLKGTCQKDIIGIALIQ